MKIKLVYELPKVERFLSSISDKSVMLFVFVASIIGIVASIVGAFI